MAIVTLASCSKSNSPDPTPTSLIVGEWTLQSGVQQINFPDGTVQNRPLTSSKKAVFTEDGRLTDGVQELTGYGPTTYVYNASTSKLILGSGAIPNVMDVVVLTKNNLRLTFVGPPSTGDHTFSVYSYNYVK